MQITEVGPGQASSTEGWESVTKVYTEQRAMRDIHPYTHGPASPIEAIGASHCGGRAGAGPEQAEDARAHNILIVTPMVSLSVRSQLYPFPQPVFFVQLSPLQ